MNDEESKSKYVAEDTEQHVDDDECISLENQPAEDEEEIDEDHCSICLQLVIDRAVIPECSHAFCFGCIITWTNQSRRCPLCTLTIGPYLIHHIRSNFDYQKYHLPPLRTSPPPIQPLRRLRGSHSNRRTARERWGMRERWDSEDELERAIEKRKWVYRHGLYAKHVASNTITRYRPLPTPAQFSASADQIKRATIFIRRELRVWVNLDIEFLTTFILSMLKAIDLRSESTIKLLAEFLDMDSTYYPGERFPNAEHFAHELSSFLRSPFRNLAAWDASVQYEVPEYRYEGSSRGRVQRERTEYDIVHSPRRSGRAYSWGPSGTTSSPQYTNDKDNNDTFRSHKLPSPLREPTAISVSESRTSDEEEANDAQDRQIMTTAITTLQKEQCEAECKGKRRAEEGSLTTGRPTGHVPHNESKIRNDDERCFQKSCERSQTNQYSLGTDALKDRATMQHSDSLSKPPPRIRSSLLIAQAHLSRSKGQTSSSQNALPEDRGRIANDASSTSQLPNGGPSLLERMTDLPSARAEGHIVHDANQDSGSGSDLASSRDALEIHDKPAARVFDPRQESRTKLLRRIMKERAIARNTELPGSTGLLSKGLKPLSGTIGATPSTSESESVGEGLRTRLLDKLTAAKVYAEHHPHHYYDVNDSHSSDNSSLSREDALRALLAQRLQEASML